VVDVIQQCDRDPVKAKVSGRLATHRRSGHGVDLAQTAMEHLSSGAAVPRASEVTPGEVAAKTGIRATAGRW
jgi:hypothetical protein